MIHDLYCLRAMMGTPESVISTEVWNEGRAISTVLSYANGARCVASWVDLPDLWDFRETLELVRRRPARAGFIPHRIRKGDSVHGCRI